MQSFPNQNLPPVSPALDLEAPPILLLPSGPRRYTRVERAGAAAISLVCVALLGTAYWLVPSATGVETHRQLGMAACGLMKSTGVPCPMCGMTTSFSHFAHGSPARAFATQPMGATLFVVTAITAWLSAYAATTGRRMGRILTVLPLWLWFTLLTLGLAAGWAWKAYVMVGSR